jgi:hypothetical protein
MESEALQLALEALEELLEQTGTPPHKNCSCHIAPPCPDCVDYSGVRYAIEQTNKVITAIKAALAQPAQEPVAWVGLTEEETSGFTQHEMTVVKYVSKVLQEKNT